MGSFTLFSGVAFASTGWILAAFSRGPQGHLGVWQRIWPSLCRDLVHLPYSPHLYCLAGVKKTVTCGFFTPLNLKCHSLYFIFFAYSLVLWIRDFCLADYSSGSPREGVGRRGVGCCDPPGDMWQDLEALQLSWFGWCYWHLVCSDVSSAKIEKPRMIVSLISYHWKCQ